MGQVTTTITPDASLFPLELDPGGIRQTNQPRAEVFFSVIDGAVTKGEAADFQVISLQFVLPANFVYALAEVFIAIQSITATADLDDWENNAFLSVIDGAAANMTALMPMHCDGTSGVFKCFYARTVVDRLVAAGTIGATFRNPVLDGNAMQVEAMVRFWQYDVAQRHNVAVQTPQMVRGAR